MNDYILRKFELLQRNIDHLRNPFQRDKIRVQIEELFDGISNDKKRGFVQYFRKRKNYVEIRHRKQFGFPCLYPIF